MLTHKWLFSLLLLLIGLAPGVASAASVGCSGGAYSMQINFGNNVDSVATARVDVDSGLQTLTCNDYYSTGPVSATICLNVSNGTSGLDANQNRLVAANIPFQVFTDPSRTQIWGGQGSNWPTNWISQSFTFNSGDSHDIQFTLYASLFPPLFNVTNGYYQISLPMTLTGLFVDGTVPPSAATACTQGNLGTRTIQTFLQIQYGVNVSADTLDFGLSDGNFSANTDQSSTLRVSCPNNQTYHISFDNGQNYAGGSRRMAGSAGHYIQYGLYQDAARTQPWGQTPNALAVSCSGVLQTLSVYGRVPVQTTQPGGLYTDSVTVTVAP